MSIRLLKPNEIEVRAQQVTEKGYMLLLYKDARVDMKLLDETYGVTGWQRTHQVVGDRLYCTIKVWDKEKNCWVAKQDVGTESNTEKEKGQASDSFKRAGTNFGIGRELYTAPSIWIWNKSDIQQYKGKFKLNYGLTFEVKEINYNEEDREITDLVIVDNNGNIKFNFKNGKEIKTNDTQYSNNNTYENKSNEKGSKAYSNSNQLLTKKQLELVNKYLNKDRQVFLDIYKATKIPMKKPEELTKTEATKLIGNLLEYDNSVNKK